MMVILAIFFVLYLGCCQRYDVDMSHASDLKSQLLKGQQHIKAYMRSLHRPTQEQRQYTRETDWSLRWALDPEARMPQVRVFVLSSSSSS